MGVAGFGNIPFRFCLFHCTRGIELNVDMAVIVFRRPANGTYQFEQTLRQGIISPLSFLDLTVSVSQLL